MLRLARQWIAGEKAEDGIERVKLANSRGILGLLNMLGEHIYSKDDVEKTVKEYEGLVALIRNNGAKSQISIKPTQFGLSIDPSYCLENYLRIADVCKSYEENYLWIDMEDSNFTQSTIDLYRQVLSKYAHCGLAIQAYLKRSENDLKELLPLGAKIRLVKGAYNEDASIAIKQRKLISANYARLLELLFSKSNPEGFIAVATHDGQLISKAQQLSKQYPRTSFEFEMLMGVRDSMKLQLVSEGIQVREYVPYGPKWMAYSLRRLREKKSNIFLLARSIFS